MSTIESEIEASQSPLDAAFEKKASRYIVGIDLGTTNCAVAYLDTSKNAATIEVFRVEQMVDIQTSQKSDTLPSFHYELTSTESMQIDSRFQFADGQHKSTVGIFARQRGMQMPGRCIASAKSWLCHTLVDRTSEMLPWSADENVKLLSPVHVSRRYLEHIRRMWDREHPSDPLSDQDVIVTLPASFDEVARQLTIQAASEAGLRDVILIEEPQAAFYAWLNRNQQTWTDTMRPGQTILVCDIGGGTTDFTLIRVVKSSGGQSDAASSPPSPSQGVGSDESEEVNRSLQSYFGLHRVAVGQHLMLGGDNLDLALARSLEQKILGDTPDQDRLGPRQWDSLKAQCRSAKEVLLGASPPAQYKMALAGAGSKLIENTRSIAIDGEWAKSLLVGGFFGRVELDDKPEIAESGFQEFGLPYAVEPNVHKHLASFLWEHRWAGRSDSDRSDMSDIQAARPDWILFNGGVLESSQIKSAVLEQIAYWFRETKTSSESNSGGTWQPGVLSGNRLDLAVAQGAAYFGLVRRGQGVRIDARLARAYYLLVQDQPPQAMCIMPANASPLDRYRMEEHPFLLSIGQPVQFPLLHSSTHLVHQTGEIVPVEPLHMTVMPALRTVIEAGNRKAKGSIPVVVESELSEIGTLAINLVYAPRETLPNDLSYLEPGTSWKLEFDVRGQSSKEMGAGSESNAMQEIRESDGLQTILSAMEAVFGSDTRVPPKDGLNQLATLIGKSRRDWNPAMLRQMWQFLLDNEAYRNQSAEHESRWLNMLGWCLRPGFGVVADDWRVNRTWRQVHNKLLHRTASNASETIVLWRRIAGGFTPGQQRALFQDCWPRVRASMGVGAPSQNTSVNVTTELLRLIGSLEWLSNEDKILVCEQAIQALAKKKLEPIHGPLLWMIGRLASRTPVYASLQQVVSETRANQWIDKLLKLDPVWMQRNVAMYSLCLMQMSRRTNDRYRDVATAVRDRVASQLQAIDAPPLHIQLVLEGGKLDDSIADTIVGEALPLGFRLLSGQQR